MRSTLADLKHGFRILRTTPLFAVVAVLTLGIGIGANAAMLALFDALLFRPPEGIHGASAIVRIATETASPGDPAPRLDDALSFMDYEALRDRAKGFASVAAFAPTPLAVGDENPTNEPVVLASGAYFQTLGARPEHGRLLQPQDDRDGAALPVAVLSYDYWKRVYGGDPAAIGKTIRIARQPFTIIGVAEPHFTGTELNAPTVWIPLNLAPAIGMSPDVMRSPYVSWLSVIGRIMPNGTQANAKTGAQAALLSIQDEKARAPMPTTRGGGGFGGRMSMRVERSGPPGPAGRNGAPARTQRADGAADGAQRSSSGGAGGDAAETITSPPPPRVVFSSIGGAGANLLRAGSGPGASSAPPVQLWYLVLTGALLLIACANVATLLLAQGSRRAHELAVRVSMGARPSRLLRQLLTENLALAMIGGAAGFIVALLIWTVLPRAISIPQLPPLLSVRPLTVTAALSLITVILFGLVPAFGMRRPDIRGMLGAAAPTLARRSLTRSTLVVLQLAASLVLLVSAGLLIRSLRNVKAADLGFASNQVLEVSANLRQQNWSPAQMEDFWTRARGAVLRVNGVQAAGLGAIPPYAGRMMLGMRSSNASGADDMIETLQDFASPEYFDALGIRILEGRAFREEDKANSEPVVIVNRQFADRLFKGQRAIGQCMPDPAGDGCLRVVGVAANARLNDLTGDVPSEMWRPLAQRPPMMPAGGVLHVRVTGDAARLITTLRRQIMGLAPELPFVNVRPITQVLEPQLAPWRAATLLLTVLSVSGLLLAAIGLYGVTAFLVSQRTRELGIRVALGASRRHIIHDVLGGGLKLTAIGVTIGVFGSIITARLFRSLMYGVTAIDPVVYGATILLLAAIALVACFVPARKATKVDPMEAFRAT
jgi:hypothetical protein